jgi:hypothetical protein
MWLVPYARPRPVQAVGQLEYQDVGVCLRMSKGKSMRSEPLFVDKVQTWPRDPLGGWSVTITEWSNEEYTVLAYRREGDGHDIIIADEPVSATGKYPSDEEILLCISEGLLERASN